MGDINAPSEEDMAKITKEETLRSKQSRGVVTEALKDLGDKGGDIAGMGLADQRIHGQGTTALLPPWQPRIFTYVTYLINLLHGTC